MAISAAPVSQWPLKSTPSGFESAAPWVVNRNPKPWWKPEIARAMATPKVPMVSTYTPIRAMCPISFAPTVFIAVWMAISTRVTIRIVECLVPSMWVLNTSLSRPAR